MLEPELSEQQPPTYTAPAPTKQMMQLCGSGSITLRKQQGARIVISFLFGHQNVKIRMVAFLNIQT
jgi:hypothetical protein